MYDISQLITKIFTDTGYKTDWARQKEPLFGTKGDPVLVFIKPYAVTSLGVLGDGITPDYYNAFSEDLSQIVQIEHICDVETHHITWNKLYKALSGWVPSEELIPEFTGLLYSGGGRMGLTNGRIFWLDNWRVDMPRVVT